MSPSIEFPKKVLKLQRLGVMTDLPDLILDKHIALFPLTENRAIFMSRNRRQSCLETGKIVVKNHVAIWRSQSPD